MQENYYKNLSEILQKSLSNIPESYFKLPQDSINALSKSAKAISASVYPSNLTDQLAEITTALSALSKATLSNVESTTIFSNALNFFGNINLQNEQNEHIELTENDCDSINTILKSSNTVDVPAKISKGKIALADFIRTVLIPILAILLPMIQNSYYHKVNSIESQKAHIEELQIQEQELQIREQELHTAEQQLQNDIEQKEILENILTKIQCLPEYFEFLPKVPEYPNEVQKPFDEVPSSLADIHDIEPITHDVPNNSVSGIHKDQ